MREVQVKTANTLSKIYIGTDVIESRLPSLTSSQKNFVVTDSNVYALYPAFFEKYFSGAEIFVLKAGEENKNFQSLYRILEKMTGAGMHRTSRLFAIGGGVVGDIGGLAAALYMRGISCVQIPTTLLAQVDSSVGGKTAVDLGGVKNVVGAFYQPCEVLIDPTFLSTLPSREMKCGLGEMVKYAALSSEIFQVLWGNQQRLQEQDFFIELIELCVRHKAKVVEADEKETGERKSLNVGHTTGHAIELSSGLSHGECVLIGMLLETKMAIDKGVCEKEYGQKLLDLISVVLQLEPKSDYKLSDVLHCAEKAKTDKKNAGDGKVVCAVAKAENEWALLSLSYAEYTTALESAVKSIQN